MASVLKDTGEIWTRLFNHRPFIRGEVIFLLREFQDTRDDRDVLQLLKILKYSTDLGQNQLNQIEQLRDYQLSSLKANIDVAFSMCSCVLEKDKLGISNKLQQNRQIRKDAWEKFINDINKKFIIADRGLQNKTKDLKKFYFNLQKKL
ncbi:PREDICTED: biogenesis of lysosome-related organelles complex 1 subunit 5-like, partial [Ceratosolen solmsi marchali]|uniref:Biogenesis of lysosome-related organelles complex 1 subunit 5 n=1 Tax=Ceratosolen solmsi marchali TaxID=326594 RepID=A0AAJ6YFC0_9HYME